MPLPDQEFITRFEDRTLPVTEFNHYGHLRLGWLYITHYTLEDAVERAAGGIRAYADSLGATDKFHFTLTAGIIRIMAELRERSGVQDLASLLRAHPALVDNIMSLVHHHYSPELLARAESRENEHSPDRAGISRPAARPGKD